MLLVGDAGFMTLFTSERLTSPWQYASVICGTDESGVAVGALGAEVDVGDVVPPVWFVVLPVLAVVLPLAQPARMISVPRSARAAGANQRGRNVGDERRCGARNDTCDIIGFPSNSGT
jgi:hypothetical protein